MCPTCYGLLGAQGTGGGSSQQRAQGTLGEGGGSLLPLPASFPTPTPGWPGSHQPLLHHQYFIEPQEAAAGTAAAAALEPAPVTAHLGRQTSTPAHRHGRLQEGLLYCQGGCGGCCGKDQAGSDRGAEKTKEGVLYVGEFGAAELAGRGSSVVAQIPELGFIP